MSEQRTEESLIAEARERLARGEAFVEQYRREEDEFRKFFEGTTLVFNEYEVARCGGLEAIQYQYPGVRIIVTPAKMSAAPAAEKTR